ncbi:MAG: dCTP deaminase [Lachnospiraceae bacterium]|nr:dCTP deaminase [Lachnospiraceae bacterium]
MILSDIQIRDRVENFKKYQMSSPLITPFLEKRLQGASYDCTISKEIISFHNIHDTVDLKDSLSIEAAYQQTEIDEKMGFTILPDEYVLLTLNETFYIPKDLTAHLRPKTRFIRLGLMMSGQHINPESICKLNIGIHNISPNPIKIYNDISIAQIVFEEMKTVPSDNKLYKTKPDANYSQDIDFVGARTTDEFDSVVGREMQKILRGKK